MGVGLGSPETLDGRCQRVLHGSIPVADIANQTSLEVASKLFPTEFSKGALLVSQTRLMR